MTQPSLNALHAMLAEQTDEVFLACVTIDHPSMATPIRVVNDTQDLARSAGTFTAFPFEITLPPDTDDTAVPQVQLSIDNVDRQIVDAIRGLSSAPSVTLEVVMASSPDTVEAGPFAFELTNAQYDALVVTGTLGYEDDLLNQPFPADTFTPGNSAGVFQ